MVVQEPYHNEIVGNKLRSDDQNFDESEGDDKPNIDQIHRSLIILMMRGSSPSYNLDHILIVKKC